MSWQLPAFVLVTLLLAAISRASLLRPRSHGFARFFAWEAIAALAILHLPVWFAEPLSWHQLVSWTLLTASLVPLIAGTRELRRAGRPAAQRESDPTLLAFEKTTQLVTTGVYRWIRHPLYSSLLLLAWGVFFKQPSIAGAGLVLLATTALSFTARADEAECRAFFGPAYDEYSARTKRFLPFVW